MGSIILDAAALIEIAFAAYCITTKSTQPKIRAWVRVGAGLSFLALTAVSVIQWSFRWYLLALLLGIWTVTAGLSLIKGRTPVTEEYRAGRTIRKGIKTWMLVLLASAPVLAFPQVTMPAPTGAQVVETATYTYTDASRVESFDAAVGNRKVTVQFWYPEAAGKYPLVIFDHGAFGMKGSNASTLRELASHGYVVGSIDHPYHSLFTKDTEGHATLVNQAFMKEVQDVNAGLYDGETAYKLEQGWLAQRTADISFVLDTVLQNNSNEKVYRLIDGAKVGLFGHSLGGAASVQLGRDRSEVDAVINLDGDLLGEYLGVKDGKPVINQERYPVPVLNIWTDDMKRAMDDAGVQPQAQLMATAPVAHEVYIAGTNHMSLTDLPLLSPVAVTLIGGGFDKVGGAAADPAAVITQMNEMVLQFFDAQLKGEGAFRSAGK